MKAIYLYDQTSREFQGSKLVDDDYVAAIGETEIKPTDGLYEPITWDGAKWNGTDQAVWQEAQQAKYKVYIKEHPEEAPQPTAEQQALTALAQQIADNDTNTATQITSIEQALTALATGGNA